MRVRKEQEEVEGGSSGGREQGALIDESLRHQSLNCFLVSAHGEFAIDVLASVQLPKISETLK
eukprot:757371-Hanusia_phi.AAC.1